MKLQEFRDFGVTDLQMDKGADLKEVDSDEETVVLYKAMAAGKNRIVEDTSLTIEGFDVGVNIRWLLDNLNIYEGARATWKVFLGVNLGMTVALFSGEIEGHIVKAPPTENKVFGFDNNFRPINSSQTLHQLSILGLKAQYSARKNGVDALLDGEPDKVVEILRIPMWSGKYQNE
jgi:inosine/xanthosine triphosphate pyrophosphatase family protein